MQATISDSTITFQIADPGPPRPRPAIRRWAERLGWAGHPDRVLTRFLGEVGEASRREEVHNLLVRAAQELTGARRVEVRPVGGPNRVLLVQGAPRATAGEPEVRLPIRFRGDPLGTLLLSPRDGRRIPPATIAHLETLCSIAAIGDRLLGRERHLRMSTSIEAEGGLKPRALLLPYLRQLVLLSRRRREPLTVLAIGLEPTIAPPRLAVGCDDDGPSDSAVAVVLSSLRESDLVVLDDDRTLIAVLPNASTANATVIADAVVRAVAEALDRPGDPGIAIGVACFPDDAREADVLLDVALEALRRAREGDRGQVVMADREAFVVREVRGEGASRVS